MMRCHPNKIDKNTGLGVPIHYKKECVSYTWLESISCNNRKSNDIRRNPKNILKFRNIIVSLKCRNQEKKIKKIWENQRKIVSLKKKTVRDR
jgi:hypothetical protein